LLKQLYECVYVPDTVWKELVAPLTEAWAEIPEDLSEILNAYSGRWLTPKRLEQKYRRLSRELVAYGIHESQADAIALAKQLKAVFFLTNDEAARKVALRHKVRTRWLTEVLLEALKVGLIRDAQNFDDALDKLVSQGLWIRKTLVQDSKDKAREISCVKG
jgi:predicted nucleic acid-binding protein